MGIDVSNGVYPCLEKSSLNYTCEWMGEHILSKPPSILCRGCSLFNTSVSFLSWTHSSALLRCEAVVFTLTEGHKGHWSRVKSQDRLFSLESSGQLSQPPTERIFLRERWLQLDWKENLNNSFHSFLAREEKESLLKKIKFISSLCSFLEGILIYFSYCVGVPHPKIEISTLQYTSLVEATWHSSWVAHKFGKLTWNQIPVLTLWTHVTFRGVNKCSYL